MFYLRVLPLRKRKPAIIKNNNGLVYFEVQEKFIFILPTHFVIRVVLSRLLLLLFRHSIMHREVIPRFSFPCFKALMRVTIIRELDEPTGCPEYWRRHRRSPSSHSAWARRQLVETFWRMEILGHICVSDADFPTSQLKSLGLDVTQSATADY